MSTPSLLCVPYRLKAGTLYSQIPDSGLGDFVVTRSASNSATRVNAQGFIETVADNVPRLDYPLGGITAGCPALLVEPASTNQIRNNSMVGAVAGTPGTLPTNWPGPSSPILGLTRQIVAVGSQNGISYIDIRFSGTASASDVIEYDFESRTQTVAASGQTWTASLWVSLTNAATAPTFLTAIRESTAIGGTLSNTTQAQTLSNSFVRLTQTRTLTNALTERTSFSLRATVLSGSTYDFTIRIGYPQMEQSSVATSVIPTTTAAITRGAETISKTGVSSLIGQTEGTIYAELDFSRAVGTIAVILGNGSGENFRIRKNANFSVLVQAVNTSGSATLFTSPAASAGIYKIAFGYKNGDYAMSVNGAAVLTSNNSVSFPVNTLDRIFLGDTVGGVPAFNDRIRAAAIYPTRLTNAQLQSLTQ